MSEHDDGGPAFPADRYNLHPNGVEQIGEHTYRCPGMTLRDYFAGQALVGCFNFWAQVKNMGVSIGDPDQQAISKLAYEYADEMLKVRATLTRATAVPEGPK